MRLRDMSYFNTGVFLLLACATASSGAHAAMRCDRKLVDIGASAYEVTSRCGNPVYQEVIREEVIGVKNSRLQASSEVNPKGVTVDLQEIEPVYRDIERWTYDQGSGQFLREVDFYNGKVIEIRTKDRGR
ncbi:MAG: DUF2845 domain-containing protein [Ketobacter sp.]|nr:MAG: DUF2845 domain-containing protein [Ketobacter sp.]